MYVCVNVDVRSSEVKGIRRQLRLLVGTRTPQFDATYVSQVRLALCNAQCQIVDALVTGKRRGL